MTVYNRNKAYPDRRPVYWADYTGPSGRRVQEPACAVGQEPQHDRRAAEQWERQRRREIVEGTWRPRGDRTDRGLTFGEWFARWHAQRRAITKPKELQRVTAYVLPSLGERRLIDIRRDDVRRIVVGLRNERRLAPRTVRHVYGDVRACLAAALRAELIDRNPCTLIVGPDELPPNVDHDPAWRHRARFERGEVESLLTSEHVPEDRRALYALALLCGMRIGEAAGRRWRDYDADSRPLGRLVVTSQWQDRDLKSPKGDAPTREIPVHRELARVLAMWRLRGFVMLFGRAPAPDDFIVPSRATGPARRSTLRARSYQGTYAAWRRDLQRVGLAHRWQHDERAWFITTAQTDGANREVVRSITHGDKVRDVISGYSRWSWQDRCAAVACIRIDLRRGELLELPRAVGDAESRDVLRDVSGEERSNRLGNKTIAGGERGIRIASTDAQSRAFSDDSTNKADAVTYRNAPENTGRQATRDARHVRVAPCDVGLVLLEATASTDEQS